MAVLTDEQRREVWADTMRLASAAREPLGTLLKDDLRAAVNAVDDRISETEAGDNEALPQAAREQLTAKWKRWLDLALRRKRLEVFHG